MRCSRCGNELNGDEMFCGSCGAPVTSGSQGTAGQSGLGTTGGGTMVQPPKPKKKTGIIVGAVAAVAAVAMGAIVFFTGGKSPKETVLDVKDTVLEVVSKEDPQKTVIEAFENLYTKDQVSPMEELFGLSAFAENAKTADAETSVKVIVESCSDSDINQLSGSGIRITGKYDSTNKEGAANVGVIYRDMDLASVDAYFDEDVIMMAVPELSSRVFTLDISDGLIERIEDSPVLGPAIEHAGIDLEEIFQYVKGFTQQTKGGDKAILDFDALMTRYREGTRAQEKFKEALIVEKGDKKKFLMDGKEVVCKGYNVTVSKDSMIDFLSTTADFFLNDKELKKQFLSQLEQSVKMAELLNGGYGYYGRVSASDLYDEGMEEVKKAVDEMIDFLDESLTDVEMEVYVAKKGRLAAVMGTTEIDGENMDSPVEVEFDFHFQGGAYLTQNMTAEITLSGKEDEVEFSMVRGGTFDGKELTCDVSVDISVNNDHAEAVWSGTYNSDGGDYEIELSVKADGDEILEISLSGVVDELEKGTLFHTDIDEFKINIMDGTKKIAFSGEYSYEPLTEELSPLKGDEFDVLAADEDEWQSVFMEFYMGAMRLINQLQL